MKVHDKPIDQRIEWLFDLARRHSAAFGSPESCLARERYLAHHPTAITAMKCMDGRINLPVATRTPLGIIQPFRNLGGMFDLGWPHLGEVLASHVHRMVASGRRVLMLITYHFSRGDPSRGCAGFDFDTDAAIALNTMKDDGPALELIRHDLAHIMARAVQDIWPDVKVTIGPVRDYGWFYDFDRAEPFTPEDLGAIEARMKQIINARDAVKTEVWDRARAIAHYEAAGEPYKIELINRIPEGEDLRMYWHGPWQDLCRGPHLQHAGQVPADGFGPSS